MLIKVMVKCKRFIFNSTGTVWHLMYRLNVFFVRCTHVLEFDLTRVYYIFGPTNHYMKSHLWVQSWFNYFFLFIWMKFTYGLKRWESWKLRLEWRMTPWWQHYDTLPAGFDRVPPRHVTALSCVSNPSQHTRTHTHTLYPLEAITHLSFSDAS